MHGNQIKVKDAQNDYIIYHPVPCYQLPPIGDDIPDEGCICTSIDPAIKNCAIRIERRYRTGHIETIQMIKVDFSKYGNTSESNGTTAVDPQILASVTSVLNQLLPIMQESRIVGIERQMAINYKATRIYQHLLTYFLMMVSTFKHYCIIMDISPKLKGKILGAPKGLVKTALKEWGIKIAIERLTWRNDQTGLKIILSHKGKSKTKADDMADTVIQMEAWFILVGGVHSKAPINIDLINYNEMIARFANHHIQNGLDPLQSYLQVQPAPMQFVMEFV